MPPVIAWAFEGQPLGIVLYFQVKPAMGATEKRIGSPPVRAPKRESTARFRAASAVSPTPSARTPYCQASARECVYVSPSPAARCTPRTSLDVAAMLRENAASLLARN